MKKKLLLIGDSISLAYEKYLREDLKEDYIIIRKDGIDLAFENLDNPNGSNIGDSNNLLSYVKNIENQNLKYNLIIFNCGLHDIRVDRDNNIIQVSENTYKSNLENIVSIVRRISEYPIWVNTTFVNDDIHNNREGGFLRFNKEVLIYNNISSEIMMKNNIKIINLYELTKNSGKNFYKDHVHFKESIVKSQANYICSYIKELKFL